MNGQKTNTVISFLDDLNKKRAMADAEANFAEDPTVKMRRLQAAKDDGREKCLSYIFGQVCSNAVPAPGEVPYTPAPIPDMDKVVGNFVSSRTGGHGATYYVKEAIKRNSECAKNLLEGVDKVINDMYMDKELNPNTITDADLKFQMTPDVTERLGKMIRDNNLDELSNVIKQNVKADAVDEVLAAKKEKDDRMALEEELRNDPSITTPEQIQEAVDARFNPRDLVFYQPRLFEGILIKHFNEAATKDQVTVEAGAALRISNGSMSYRGRSILSGVNDMFTNIEEPTLAKYSERLKGILTNENCEVRRKYYWEIMPIDINKLSQKFSALISNRKMDPEQKIEVIDTDRYIRDMDQLQDAIRTALTDGTDIIDLPIRMSRTISVSEVFEELRRNIAAIKLEKVFGPSVEKFVSYAEEISAKYGRTSNNLASTFKVVAIAALINIDIMNMYIVNASNLIEKVRDTIQEAETTQPMNEAFVNALYEYTMFNVAKALRLESFTSPEVKEIAKQYAQNR